MTDLDVVDVEARAVAPEWFRLEEQHFGSWRAGRIGFLEQRRLRLRDFLPVVGRSLAEEALDGTFERYLAGYEQGWAAYEDALPALQRIQAAGLRVAVLTNGEQDQQTAKLRTIGLLDLCGTVVASSSTGCPKPDPGAYAAACAVHLDRAGTHPVPDLDRIRTLADLPL